MMTSGNPIFLAIAVLVSTRWGYSLKTYDENNHPTKIWNIYYHLKVIHFITENIQHINYQMKTILNILTGISCLYHHLTLIRYNNQKVENFGNFTNSRHPFFSRFCQLHKLSEYYWKQDFNCSKLRHPAIFSLIKWIILLSSKKGIWFEPQHFVVQMFSHVCIINHM